MFNLEALCSILEYASPTHRDNGVFKTFTTLYTVRVLGLVITDLYTAFRSRSRSRLRARFPLRSCSRSRSRLGARAIFVVPVYAKTRHIISSRLWICWQCAKPIPAPKSP